MYLLVIFGSNATAANDNRATIGLWQLELWHVDLPMAPYVAARIPTPALGSLRSAHVF